MNHCEGCHMPGHISPLFPRPFDIDGARVIYRLLCSACQHNSNAEILNRLALWEPPFDPYDRRALGVGA